MTPATTARQPTALKLWETVSRKLVADGSPWLKVWAEQVRLPDGRVIDPFYSIEMPDFVVIFPVSAEGNVLTIWHYKHGPRRVNLGLPAGLVTPGEQPAVTARRELLEETGYEAADIEALGAFSVDGNRGCGRGHAFLARGLELRARPTQDDLEEIVLDWMTPAALRQALQSGKVATMGAATGIALGLLHINKGTSST